MLTGTTLWWSELTASKIRLLQWYVFFDLFFWDRGRLHRLPSKTRTIWNVAVSKNTLDRENNQYGGAEKDGTCKINPAYSTRKLQYLGRIMHNESRYVLLQFFQGKVYGGRGVGKMRISWLKNLNTCFNHVLKFLSYQLLSFLLTTQLFRAAVRITNMIATSEMNRLEEEGIAKKPLSEPSVKFYLVTSNRTNVQNSFILNKICAFAARCIYVCCFFNIGTI